MSRKRIPSKEEYIKIKEKFKLRRDKKTEREYAKLEPILYNSLIDIIAEGILLGNSSFYIGYKAIVKHISLWNRILFRFRIERSNYLYNFTTGHNERLNKIVEKIIKELKDVGYREASFEFIFRQNYLLIKLGKIGE